MKDKNHFVEIDTYLRSISEIVKMSPESIEYKQNQIIAIKDYQIAGLSEGIRDLPIYSLDIDYRSDGWVYITYKKIIGETVHQIDKPWTIEYRMFDND